MILAYPLAVPGGEIRDVATRHYTARDARKIPFDDRFDLRELAAKAGIGLGHVLDLDLGDVDAIEARHRSIAALPASERPRSPTDGIVFYD